MKIGITCYPIYGGSGVVATELGKALARRGHQVHFISYRMPFRLVGLTNNIFYHEVGVRSYPVFDYCPYTLALSSTMVDVVRYEKLDLIHVHYAIPHAASAVLARDILRTQGLSLPIVTTLHGTDITIVGQDPSFVPVVTYSLNASDGITAVSEALRRETYSAFNITREIEVIPNFINIDQFSRRPNEEVRSRLFPRKEKVMVHISNFRPIKNTSHVVEVFHNLRRQGMPVKLLLVGDGPDRGATEHKARALGIYEHVRFLGKQDPVSEILSLSDVFFMPSDFESFGLAALEAMACGVPVVCSDAGGLPELVNGSGAGIICPRGDIDAYTEATARLLQDDVLRGKMAQAARDHAVNKYDERMIIPQYEAYYNRVLADLS